MAEAMGKEKRVIKASLVTSRSDLRWITFLRAGQLASIPPLAFPLAVPAHRASPSGVCAHSGDPPVAVAASHGFPSLRP